MEKAPDPTPDQPKHKPSPRHTLEEVLRSLQDMVRNELAEAGKRQPPRRPPPEPAAGAASPREIEQDLRTVLHTLKDETAPDAVTGGAPERPAGPFGSSAKPSVAPNEFALEPSPFPAPPGIIEPETPPDAPEPEVWTGAQPDLPLLALHPGPGKVAPAAEPDPGESSGLEDIQFIGTGADEEPVAAATLAPERTPEPAPDRSKPQTAPPSTAERRRPPPAAQPAPQEPPPDDASAAFAGTDPDAEEWVEIPVLEDAVYLPPESSWSETPAEDSGIPGTGTPPPNAAADFATARQPPEQLEVPLPSPEGARDVAIRTAARLNIELKRSGRRGLSNDVIVRLTRILRESLAQAGANMDNTGPNDKP